MRVVQMQLVFLSSLVSVISLGCSKTCSEIGCVPIISVSYASSISGAYRLQVSALDATFGPIDCPRTDGPTTLESGLGCNADGFSLQGRELFRGSNPPAQISVKIDELSSPSVTIPAGTMVTTQVTGSLNGDGCDMNCFRAQGVVATSP